MLKMFLLKIPVRKIRGKIRSDITPGLSKIERSFKSDEVLKKLFIWHIKKHVENKKSEIFHMFDCII